MYVEFEYLSYMMMITITEYIDNLNQMVKFINKSVYVCKYFTI